VIVRAHELLSCLHDLKDDLTDDDAAGREQGKDAVSADRKATVPPGEPEPPVGQGPTKPRAPRYEWLAKAMLLVKEHPEYSDRRIARAVKIDPSQLTRSAEYQVAAALARAGAILERLGRIHAENHPATWQAEREKTLEQLNDLLAHERKEHATARPARFEHEFGLDSEGHSLALDDGQVLTFRGRIDRVDALAKGGIQVVDYKTGKSGNYKRDSLAGGTQLQLPIYLLAACEAMQARRGRALYLCVDEPKDVPEFSSEQLAERMADFRRALGLIVDGIASGNFFPMPAEDPRTLRYCSEYCPNSIACGSARSKLAEMKQADPDLSGLRALRAIE
jgi:hypothetical protein